MFKGNYVNFLFVQKNLCQFLKKIQLNNLIFSERLNILLVPTKLSNFFSPIKKDDMF